MSIRKRIAVLTWFVVLAVALMACGKQERGSEPLEEIATDSAKESTTEIAKEELSDKVFIPSEACVRAIGRTKEQDDTLWLVHSGTGAEFSFVGTLATITMRPDSMLNSGMDGQARIAIYVNGERVVDEMVNKLEKSYTVFESDTPQECTVRVIKLSEAANSTVGIAKIEVTSIGDIVPTENSDRLIEFVGDSITCGYGVDDENKEHHFSTTTEDITRTYAYKTAQALGADYSMVSFSGYGIISGYSGNGERVSEQTLPQYYDKLGFSYGAYMGTYYAQDVAWDFAKRQPDVIVINLGTNDHSYVKGDADKEEEYIIGYVEFLKKVRAYNPDATILCTLGIMGAELYPAVTEAVERYMAETGDVSVYAMSFEVQSASDGYAADWHPTETTHEKASHRLTAEIQNIMGW